MMVVNSNLTYSKLFLVRQAARSGCDHSYTFYVVRSLMFRLSRGEGKIRRMNWLVVSSLREGNLF